MGTRLTAAQAAACFLACSSLTAATPKALAAEKITWRPVEHALLKVNDQPVKLWNIYQAAKKNHLVLVKIWRRYLVLDLKARQVYDLDPATLDHRGDELRGPAPGKAQRPVPSADWNLRDVGPAEMVRVKLTAEGRVLELQLPHPLDLRGVY